MTPDLPLTSQQQSIAIAPWAVHISRPAEGRRLSWPEWLVTYQDSIHTNGQPSQYNWLSHFTYLLTAVSELLIYCCSSLALTISQVSMPVCNTAIPGQPVGKSEQTPASSSKNQFNIDVPRWETYQILS